MTINHLPPIAIIPAIDLIDNKCVRLKRGDYNQMTVYSDQPVDMAMLLQDQGADILHIVDLEAAKIGQPVHHKLIEKIQNKLSIPVEVGGGIRSKDNVSRYLDIGIRRIILGTSVISDETFAMEMLSSHGELIIFGLDAHIDKIAVKGWTEATNLTVSAIANKFEPFGLREIIYTDINRDGVLNGPNSDMLKDLLEKTTVKIIASGGIGSYDHIETLLQLNVNGKKVSGIIIGKAFYEKKVEINHVVRIRNTVS